MKISELKDEQAIIAIAEIIEPLGKIVSFEEAAELYKSGKKLKAISVTLKKYPKEMIEILAALEGVPVDEYHCNIMTLPMKISEIIKTPEAETLFTFAETATGGAHSGSASGNITVYGI